ncbi:helical backbone metal receptor [uncultured Cohaesibacter sp.]|uniref:helical backbone metal receptor n=1 Tax=uncultured Cohaesibacter sp. TaxID=1002546 RepID=UPI00292FEF61|nr:helical backbone metal receptor [uncultured Cohaesibacter sp.]
MKKRVISLVPSWTETLLAAGITPVGRSRYCIHPADLVADIPAVGGTKDWDWQKIVALEPDLLLLDREENVSFMSEQTDIDWFATHVTSIHSMPQTLTELAELFASDGLEDMASRWRAVLAQKPRRRAFGDPFPGLLGWGKRPQRRIDRILYMVWCEPWVAVSRDTFIGSLLGLLDLDIGRFETHYPRIELSDFDQETTLLLLASEPYPFWQKKEELCELQFPHAFVDGESISWYGIRSLRFLEKALARQA